MKTVKLETRALLLSGLFSLISLTCSRNLLHATDKKPAKQDDAKAVKMVSAVIAKAGDRKGGPVAAEKLQMIQNEFLNIDFIGELIENARKAKGWEDPAPNSPPDYSLSIEYSNGTTVDVASWGEYYFHVNFSNRRGSADRFTAKETTPGCEKGIEVPYRAIQRYQKVKTTRLAVP